MNTTSRAILNTLLTDQSLSEPERGAVQRLMSGETQAPATAPSVRPKLLTQGAVAELLSVSRVTVWRMTRDAVLHPVEILPGTWRYRMEEVAELANGER